VPLFFHPGEPALFSVFITNFNFVAYVSVMRYAYPVMGIVLGTASALGVSGLSAMGTRLFIKHEMG